jgi:hypothetical protein
MARSLVTNEDWLLHRYQPLSNQSSRLYSYITIQPLEPSYSVKLNISY